MTVSPLTFSLLMVSDPFFRLSMIDLSVTTDLSHSIALLNLTGCFVLTVLYLCSVQPELSELSDLQTYFESLAVSSELPSCLHHLSFASQSFFLPRFHRTALPYQPKRMRHDHCRLSCTTFHHQIMQLHLYFSLFSNFQLLLPLYPVYYIHQH